MFLRSLSTTCYRVLLANHSTSQITHAIQRSFVTILFSNLRICDRYSKTHTLCTQTLQFSSENVDHRLKLIELEIYELRQNGHKAPNPDLLNEDQWENLLKLKTKSARSKYYSYLYITEKRKEAFQIKQEIKKQANQERKELKAEETPQKHIDYSLGKTSFLLRVRESTMDHWRNNRLTRAMQFGSKLIYDCSYEEHMTPREAKYAAKQLRESFANNRKHKQPFDLHFCNVNYNSNTMMHLQKLIPTITNKAFPLHVHEVSYLELFPKEILVYLTPHCNIDLVEYDPESVYIVGAMVDKGNSQPLSLGKAKKLGLRMARLPLDRYLKWSDSSSKSLTLDQMMKIMLDIKETRNWKYALRHVPRRKVINKR